MVEARRGEDVPLDPVAAERDLPTVADESSEQSSSGTVDGREAKIACDIVARAFADPHRRGRRDPGVDGHPLKGHSRAEELGRRDGIRDPRGNRRGYGFYG